MELGVGDGEAVGTVGQLGETGAGKGMILKPEREKQRLEDERELKKGKVPGEGWQPAAWSPGRSRR